MVGEIGEGDSKCIIDSTCPPHPHAIDFGSVEYFIGLIAGLAAVLVHIEKVCRTSSPITWGP